ncbi:MAG: glycosyl transferase [Capsulimonas sp.]|uniref:glycosyl transferase n=1 Tax=Capsulimonas sp. TaxID=2494211 RepID=UPI0032673A48
MRYYCTYFDRRYLIRGLALYRSLKRHAEPFTLWVLCFDDETFDALTKMALPEVHPVRLSDFESHYPELKAAKSDRTIVEYYFTCSPFWPLYLLDQHPEIDIVTYLDADLLFYASPEPIFEELGDNSVLIIEHRFPKHLLYMEANGHFNVGLLMFRNNAIGRECLQWWRARCLEWCFDRCEDDRYADQKYLDKWPELFQGVRVLQHKGAGLAPWNWMNYRLALENGQMTVDGEPLIFFHFHGLKIFSSFLFDPVFAGKIYGEMTSPFAPFLYSGYVNELRDTAAWARQTLPNLAIEYTPIAKYGWRIFLSKVRRGKLMTASGVR